MIRFFDVVVVGGGPAGMAAALSAEKNGAKTLLIERDSRLGGILNQCIHNGFGLHYFNIELTGPEYADRFVKKIQASGVEVWTDTFVTQISADKKLQTMSEKGIIEIQAKAIIFAMGCRERGAGAIAIPGFRPVGVWTAGMAQNLCNNEGKLVGKKIVVLGSGDIGLIMARRFTFEGAKVEMVCELMPYSSGLKRNIVQCLDDFDIPLNFSTTVTKIVGEKRVEGVFVAKVDENKQVLTQTEKFVACDALILSVGLVPENDLIANLNFAMDLNTNGPIVDQFRQTSANGFFSCGNCLHVHDLVDNVSNEAQIAGENAAKFASNCLEKGKSVFVIAGNGVRYALPHKIQKGQGTIKILLRSSNVFKNMRLVAKSGEVVLFKKNFMIVTPGEMEDVEIETSKITDDVVVMFEPISGGSR